jgi:hypothetical protein
VEQVTFAISVGRVAAVQKDDTQMRIESLVTVCSLNDSDGAGLARGKTALDVAAAVPARNSVREDAHNLAKQLPVEGQRVSSPRATSMPSWPTLTEP